MPHIRVNEITPEIKESIDKMYSAGGPILDQMLKDAEKKMKALEAEGMGRNLAISTLASDLFERFGRGERAKTAVVATFAILIARTVGKPEERVNEDEDKEPDPGEDSWDKPF